MTLYLNLDKEWILRKNKERERERKKEKKEENESSSTVRNGTANIVNIRLHLVIVQTREITLQYVSSWNRHVEHTNIDKIIIISETTLFLSGKKVFSTNRQPTFKDFLWLKKKENQTN